MNNLKSKIIIKIYRKGNYFHNCNDNILNSIMSILYKFLYKIIVEMIFGTEMAFETRVGNNLILEHGGNGVIIHADTRIGDNVVIYQQVTIGGFGLTHFDEEYRKKNPEKGAGAPKIGNNVVIGAGAKILGNVTVGDGARIGANAVVLKDVPTNSTAVGVPAKVVKS